MSDRCNKARKLSAKKAKHRKCYFKMNKTSGAGTGSGSSSGSGSGSGNGGCGTSANSDAIIAKNHMQQFCIDSNSMVNTARNCSFSGKAKEETKNI